MRALVLLALVAGIFLIVTGGLIIVDVVDLGVRENPGADLDVEDAVGTVGLLAGVGVAALAARDV